MDHISTKSTLMMQNVIHISYMNASDIYIKTHTLFLIGLIKVIDKKHLELTNQKVIIFYQDATRYYADLAEINAAWLKCQTHLTMKF